MFINLEIDKNHFFTSKLKVETNHNLKVFIKNYCNINKLKVNVILFSTKNSSVFKSWYFTIYLPGYHSSTLGIYNHHNI